MARKRRPCRHDTTAWSSDEVGAEQPPVEPVGGGPKAVKRPSGRVRRPCRVDMPAWPDGKDQADTEKQEGGGEEERELTPRQALFEINRSLAKAVTKHKDSGQLVNFVADGKWQSSKIIEITKMGFPVLEYMDDRGTKQRVIATPEQMLLWAKEKTDHPSNFVYDKEHLKRMETVMQGLQERNDVHPMESNKRIPIRDSSGRYHAGVVLNPNTESGYVEVRFYDQGDKLTKTKEADPEEILFWASEQNYDLANSFNE